MGDSEPDTRLTLREPVQDDAAEIWQLVRDSGALDVNSPYAYLLLCTHFAQTGLVARDAEGELLAFVLGYRLPEEDETLFVWQIGVARAHRSKGLGCCMLDTLFDRCRSRSHLAYLEAIVTPSNVASRILFTRFARDRSARIYESVAFSSSNFPSTDQDHHEDEIRLRIGPIRRQSD